MRQWIYKALSAVVIQQEYSNLYLRHHLHECPKKDQALATRIFYGTLQNWNYCQKAWQIYTKNQPNKKIGLLLTMSSYQLLFLDKVPSYAIVNDAVQIAKAIQPSSKGFVNAILRKVKPLELDESLASLAIQYSLPEWLLRLWIKQYGQEQAIENAKASLHILPTYVRRNPMKIDEEHFFEHANIKKSQNVLAIYTGNDLSKDLFYIEGKMSAQDIGSYEISRFMDIQKGDCVLDCCAAPGTKSMAMAELVGDQASITCLDLHAHRVNLIKKDVKRLGLQSIQALQADATKYQSKLLFDRILCDVPCSGYGVLSRKPDIKLRLQPEDMDELIPLQYAILENISQYLKQGGILVYSTCTLNKKENEKQIASFLKTHPNFVLLEEKTLFPSEFNDGFYMAKIQLNKTLL